MSASQIKAARDARLARAMWAAARGADVQAERNFAAAERWTRAYFAALRNERMAVAA